MRRRELPTRQAFLDAVKGSKSNREVLYHLGWDPDSGGSHRLLRTLFTLFPASNRHFWPDARRKVTVPEATVPGLTVPATHLLHRLYDAYVRQRLIAQYGRKRFAGGWTYHRPTRDLPLSTLRRLIVLGYAQPCCREENGTGHVRITPAGLQAIRPLVPDHRR